MSEEYEIVPGTTYLVDVNNISNLGDINVKKRSDIILFPQPSNDPNDPLNWSKARKEFHFALVWLWGFILAAAVNWIPPVYDVVKEYYRVSYNTLNIASALCFLFLGLGCLILQPIALKIGRRPVYMMGSISDIIGCIVCGIGKTVGSLHANNCLAGFGAAPVDSLIQISITDIFFLHEHGRRLSIYTFSLYAGSYLSPVAAGYVYKGQGNNWKWIIWWFLIINSALLVLQFFCMEESLYKRDKSTSNKPLTGDVGAGFEYKLKHSGSEDESHNSTHKNEKFGAAAISNDQVDCELEVGEISGLIPLKSYKEKLRLWSPQEGSDESIIRLFYTPFLTGRYPAVVWSSVLYGIQISWLSLLNVTQSEFFGTSPYNWSTSTVGLVNLASFVGGMLGMLYGASTDIFQLYLTRRNKGYYEPEFRLWTLTIGGIINTAGILMYGLGVSHGINWVFPVFGVGFIGFGISACGATSMTYSVDSYPEQTGQTMVFILFVRNMLGMIFTFVFQYWIDGMGINGTTGLCAAICFASNYSFIIFIIWGKRWRRMTSKWYLKEVEQAK